MRHLALASIQGLEKTAQLFYQNIWKLHELSNSLTFNRKSRFISECRKLIYLRLYVDTQLITSYNLKTDGQRKYMRVVIEYYFRAYIYYFQDNWAK